MGLVSVIFIIGINMVKMAHFVLLIIGLIQFLSLFRNYCFLYFIKFTSIYILENIMCIYYYYHHYYVNIQITVYFCLRYERERELRLLFPPLITCEAPL